MIKLRKLFLPIIALGITSSAISFSLTACQPAYLILRDIDYSGGVTSDSNLPASKNSRIIDVTNTKFYIDDYKFLWDETTIPTTARVPETSKTDGYVCHLILFACDVAYTIKVTASINYESTICKESIVVNVKATV